ncbi:hypothetical protein OKW39_009093 [Paraburkholderia sp. MM6662-R1]
MPAYRVRNAVTGRLVHDAVTMHPRTFDLRDDAEQCAMALQRYACVGDGAARYEVEVFEAWVSQGDLA